jgi:esterase
MKLFFRKSGEGNPLIILHGLFGMSDNWMTLSKQFAEIGFTVYAADARNHGRSPHSDYFNYPVMCEDVLEMMADENMAHAAILGHSMGAKTAMWLACMHPERISKLISSDMAPRAYAPHHQNVLTAIHSVNLSATNSRKEAEDKLRETLRDEGTVQFLLKNLYWNEQDKLAWRFNLDGIEKNIAATGTALPADFRFEGETLFLRGEKSGYISDSDTAAIKKHFPRATVKTVANAGHWIHAENPAGFMEAALMFLKA